MFWLLIAAILVAYVFHAIYHSKYWERKGIPGPKPTPFVGNLMEIRNQKAYSLNLAEWTKQYGDVYGIQKGRTNILVISNPKLIKEVIVDKFEIFHARESPPSRGDPETMPRANVFSAAGKRWKRLRTLASPAFSVANLKKVMPIIDESADEMMKHLERRLTLNQSFDIQPFFFEFTLDVICRAALGHERSMQFENPYREDLYYFFRHLSHPLSDLSHMIPALWRPLRFLEMGVRRFEGVGIIPLIHGMEKAVKERQAKRNAGDVDSEPADFIDIFLNSLQDDVKLEKTGLYDKTDVHIEKKLSLGEVFANCMVFLLAGYDTTANVLTFTSYFLAKHPEVQEKLRAEIEEICVDQSPSYEQLNSLRYTEAVMKEALRLMPIASAAVNRTCAQGTVLGGTIEIQQGDCIEVDVVSYHRRKDVWGEDAEEFRPERFLEESKTEQIYGFGGGPRICIGMRLAYLEEKMALVKLLRRYRFKAGPETDPLTLSGTLILSSDNMKLIVEEI
ncbi:unnamed protein product [Bursaphelenchus xylophilus]|uniref:(pine wood nematode) hypothetical protein n=1 Tax=Bursaphelenchus xylophilus TaxID=6326 RepID=A0A1I7RKF6_BURXY|nr:unnamed protein product [Bursaphelenchus xylophilus]CAG9131350.1 unnamed protein product [Bursaphelenchus xylophilus]